MPAFTERQKAVLDLLKGSAEPLFALHGIQVQRREKAGAVYLNLSSCPWCGHGEAGNPNFQCGVRESPGSNGGFMHSYKCQHPHHAVDGDDTPHYADVLAQLGALSTAEASWVKNLRTELDRQANQVKVQHSASELRAANPVFKDRLNRRLLANQAALNWLQKTRGFSPAVIDHFQLGLSEPYTPKGDSQVQTSDALAAPLLARDGKFYSKYVNYAVPGVTQDNRPKKLKAWSSGPARTYFSEKADNKKRIFLCDGLKDLWAIWDKMRGTPLANELLLVSSTNGGSGYPEEWKLPGFWDPWEMVYLGHDNDKPDPRTGKKAGDEHAKSVARMAMREMRRVWPMGYKDWNDFFLDGKTLDDFEQLLLNAYPLSLKELSNIAPGENEVGLHAALPVAVAGSFHNGHLYEAVEVLERTRDEETNSMLERYRTVVVRSDGTLHSTAVMPAPKGTRLNQLVHRLVPDGTMLDGPVKPSPYCSWHWQSVQAFVEGKAKQKGLGELLVKVRDHLRASVWLPFEDDYTLLGCTVVATYVQSIFDAVPLLLATGAAGTGKTALGIAMSEVCANSPKTAVGQISAASIARLIDQSRGFVVLDDLESIGGKRNGDSQFDDLIQALKLSYNKQSAIKFWTNMKTNTLEKLNFFGIKLINNTRGVDAILGSRMFKIATRKMPDGMALSSVGKLDPTQRFDLRNDLHTWAFMNAAAVSQTYAVVFPNKTSRADEISAPLKVIATLAGDAALNRSLEHALMRQERNDVLSETTEQIAQEALEHIIQRSYEERGVVRTVVTITELMMRMALLVDTNFGKNSTTDLSDIENPEVVGRIVKQTFAKSGAQQIRVQLHGKFLRAYPLEEQIVEKALLKLDPKLRLAGTQRIADPKDFCQGCSSCDYRYRCEMRAAKETREVYRVSRGAPSSPLPN